MPPIAPISTRGFAAVVVGASGDLALRKIYPALFRLFCAAHASGSIILSPIFNLEPKTHPVVKPLLSFLIVGYARSSYSIEDFRTHLRPALEPLVAGDPNASTNLLDAFLTSCSYVSGQYDDARALTTVGSMLADFDASLPRLLYLAVPPTVFLAAARALREACYNHPSSNSNCHFRIIVEKPFGKDLASYEKLHNSLSPIWPEEQTYRIDHYLGKPMIANIPALRLGSAPLTACWNADHIEFVHIFLKEKIDLKGRAGYFDNFGIIRDVFQNHLTQIYALLAMETDSSHIDIRDAKVALLRSTRPLDFERDCLVAQYDGYRDETDVSPASHSPTYAACVLYPTTPRWRGVVPFACYGGKALDESTCQVHVKFRGNSNSNSNSMLCIRIQPNEAVWLTSPLGNLTLNYANSNNITRIPDAYEALICDAAHGVQDNFVRADELDAAWTIFTPMLHHIDNFATQQLLHTYVHGSAGPETQLAELLSRHKCSSSNK